MLKTAHRIVNDLLKKAEENPRLKFFVPMLDATDTFFARPSTLTMAAPHVRGHMDLKRMMMTVVLCAAPCALMGIYLFGWKAAAIIAVSYIFGVGTEAVFAGVKGETINEGAFVTCILYPLILPVTTPLWMAAVGIVFGIIFAKEAFGGTGYNVFNPALVSRCFLYVCFPGFMTGPVWVRPFWGGAGGFVHWMNTGEETFRYWAGGMVDTITGATAASAWKTKEAADAFADLPTTNLLVGNIPGCIGETCKVLILLAGLVLILTKVADWRLAAAPIFSALALSSIFYYTGVIDRFYGDAMGSYPYPMMNVLAGGLLFGAVFMSTDPVSAPMLPWSKWIYGSMIGILAILIRTFSGFPQGLMFSILLMNTFAPLLDYGFRKLRYRKAREAVVV